MDNEFATNFKVLKGENRKVVGFKISSAGNGGDEYFCEMLSRNLDKGKAEFTISDETIFIESIGIGGVEKWSFDLSKDEAFQLQEILSGLGKTYQGRYKTKRRWGVHFEATFLIL